MTVVAIDGFDLYNGTGTGTGLQSKWTGTVTNWSMGTGRFGVGQRIKNTSASSTQVLARTLPAAVTTIAVGFAFRVTNLSSMQAPEPLMLRSNTTYQCGIRINADGTVSVGRASSAIATGFTALATSASPVIFEFTDHYIELEAVISTTAGRMTVYVDGVQAVTVSSANTANAGAGTTVNVVALSPYASGSGGAVEFDDLYVNDVATKLGERRVETLYPTSDVAQGFARSTGATNYTLVDDPQANGDTDYVQGSLVGDVDTYGIGDLSSTPTTVDAVQITAFAEKTDATTRSIALQVKSGATTSDGTNFSLATSYSRFERLLTADPNTSAAWMAAAVNALQGGPKVTV